MQIQQLTQNGIERLLKGETIIGQIINTVKVPIEKRGQILQIITATVNDGFTSYSSVYVHPQYFPNSNVNFNVIKIKLSQGQLRKLAKQSHKSNVPLVTDMTAFVVVNNQINYIIGNPINYQDYIKNGKKNIKGNRNIFYHDKSNSYDDVQDQLFSDNQKLRQKLSQKQKVQNKSNYSNKPINKTPAQISSTLPNRNLPFKKQFQNTNRQNSTSMPNKPTQQSLKTKPYQSTKPIIKIQHIQKPQQKRNSIKPQVKHHNTDHQKIKQLFLGIQSFRLIARLLFVMPIKTFTTKKGTQSQLLNMDFGDQTGIITCTVFGDLATRYSTLEVDKIYSISGATVNQSKYKGITQLKLIFNDSTILNIISDAKTIPTVDKFCVSLKQLIQAQKGKILPVKCLIKQGQFVQFISKNGNNVKKKTLKMYDLDNQIECDLTIFNQKAQIQYLQGMYALKGVQVDEFQGNKQFKGSITFFARYLKGHVMNKRMKQVQQLTFTSIITSNQKMKKDLINTFSELIQRSQDIKIGENLWSQTICYLKGIRLNNGAMKNVYLSCPHCKKKISDDKPAICQNCKNTIDNPKYKYLLHVNLIDDHDNIWATTYDQGQKILNTPQQDKFTADLFASMSDQMIKQRTQQIRYKQLKVKMVTTKESYNNEIKVRHKVVKVLPIDFVEECRNLLQKIKSATNSL